MSAGNARDPGTRPGSRAQAAPAAGPLTAEEQRVLREGRFLVLTEGHLGIFSSKTAAALLRYRPEDVVALLDSQRPGGSLQEVVGVEASVRMVPTLAEGLALGPGALVIGISPAGGQLPAAWRPILKEAIGAGLHVISTLHVFLAEDPELSHLARERQVRLIDLRRPPASTPIAHARAKETTARRILTVGTDSNVGKMTVSLEIAAAACRAGLDARFLATGQTGMLLTAAGVAIDRVIGDFMAGVTEELVLAMGDADWVVVEGQGCLLHPAFSGVTAALLHGSLPDCMILCHHAGRDVMRNQTTRIPPLNDWITRYEEFVQPLHRGRVVGIALNCHGMSDADARTAIAAAEEETGLPATDVIRFGPEPLVRAVQEHGLIAGS